MTITWLEWEVFKQRYFSGRIPHQRFGQAFVNEFGLQNVPELFCEPSDAKALLMALEYVGQAEAAP
jgi:hypothetical protein